MPPKAASSAKSPPNPKPLTAASISKSPDPAPKPNELPELPKPAKDQNATGDHEVAASSKPSVKPAPKTAGSRQQSNLNMKPVAASSENQTLKPAAPPDKPLNKQESKLSQITTATTKQGPGQKPGVTDSKPQPPPATKPLTKQTSTVSAAPPTSPKPPTASNLPPISGTVPLEKDKSKMVANVGSEKKTGTSSPEKGKLPQKEETAASSNPPKPAQPVTKPKQLEPAEAKPVKPGNNTKPAVPGNDKAAAKPLPLKEAGAVKPGTSPTKIPAPPLNSSRGPSLERLNNLRGASSIPRLDKTAGKAPGAAASAKPATEAKSPKPAPKTLEPAVTGVNNKGKDKIPGLAYVKDASGRSEPKEAPGKPAAKLGPPPRPPTGAEVKMAPPPRPPLGVAVPKVPAPKPAPAAETKKSNDEISRTTSKKKSTSGEVGPAPKVTEVPEQIQTKPAKAIAKKISLDSLEIEKEAQEIMKTIAAEQKAKEEEAAAKAAAKLAALEKAKKEEEEKAAAKAKAKEKSDAVKSNVEGPKNVSKPPPGDKAPTKPPATRKGQSVPPTGSNNSLTKKDTNKADAARRDSSLPPRKPGEIRADAGKGSMDSLKGKVTVKKKLATEVQGTTTQPPKVSEVEPATEKEAVKPPTKPSSNSSKPPLPKKADGKQGGSSDAPAKRKASSVPPPSTKEGSSDRQRRPTDQVQKGSSDKIPQEKVAKKSEEKLSEPKQSKNQSTASAKTQSSVSKDAVVKQAESTGSNDTAPPKPGTAKSPAGKKPKTPASEKPKPKAVASEAEAAVPKDGAKGTKEGSKSPKEETKGAKEGAKNFESAGKSKGQKASPKSGGNKSKGNQDSKGSADAQEAVDYGSVKETAVAVKTEPKSTIHEPHINIEDADGIYAMGLASPPTSARNNRMSSPPHPVPIETVVWKSNDSRVGAPLILRPSHPEPPPPDFAPQRFQDQRRPMLDSLHSQQRTHFAHDQSGWKPSSSYVSKPPPPARNVPYQHQHKGVWWQEVDYPYQERGDQYYDTSNNQFWARTGGRRSASEIPRPRVLWIPKEESYDYDYYDDEWTDYGWERQSRRRESDLPSFGKFQRRRMDYDEEDEEDDYDRRDNRFCREAKYYSEPQRSLPREERVPYPEYKENRQVPKISLKMIEKLERLGFFDEDDDDDDLLYQTSTNMYIKPLQQAAPQPALIPTIVNPSQGIAQDTADLPNATAPTVPMESPQTQSEPPAQTTQLNTIAPDVNASTKPVQQGNPSKHQLPLAGGTNNYLTKYLERNLKTNGPGIGADGGIIRKEKDRHAFLKQLSDLFEAPGAPTQPVVTKRDVRSRHHTTGREERYSDRLQPNMATFGGAGRATALGMIEGNAGKRSTRGVPQTSEDERDEAVANMELFKARRLRAMSDKQNQGPRLVALDDEDNLEELSDSNFRPTKKMNLAKKELSKSKITSLPKVARQKPVQPTTNMGNNVSSLPGYGYGMPMDPFGNLYGANGISWNSGFYNPSLGSLPIPPVPYISSLLNSGVPTFVQAPLDNAGIKGKQRADEANPLIPARFKMTSVPVTTMRPALVIDTGDTQEISYPIQMPQLPMQLPMSMPIPPIPSKDTQGNGLESPLPQYPNQGNSMFGSYGPPFGYLPYGAPQMISPMLMMGQPIPSWSMQSPDLISLPTTQPKQSTNPKATTRTEKSFQRRRPVR